MSILFKQIVSTLVLAVLFGIVFILRTPDPAGRDALTMQKALEHYGVFLREGAKELGIEFTHRSPTLDAWLDPIMPIVASMGAAVSVVDFDRDGWLDIYVINSGEGSKNALYRNKGN